MTTEEADARARTFTEVAALGMLDSSVWQQFMDGWTADVKRRINGYFTDATAGSVRPDTGSVSGSVSA
jgi:hypothetical protein